VLSTSPSPDFAVGDIVGLNGISRFPFESNLGKGATSVKALGSCVRVGREKRKSSQECDKERRVRVPSAYPGFAIAAFLAFRAD
jgi:hypothetical protein